MVHNTSAVVTRFAPSPTGFLHIGGVRTALFAYLFAKQQGGTFILRIEDTDKAREVQESAAHIMESLRWLELEWDYGPDKPGPFGSCIQSERLAVYQRYAEALIAKGLAYVDPYTPTEVDEFRAAATAQKQPFLFRNHRPDPSTLPAWDGTQPLRFKVPHITRTTWTDVVRGELSAGPEALDDFIIMKADGFPTYNFAHIVDDYEMGVTHVMRGEEFIASTPKFISLIDALEFPRPQFVTLPPIMGPDGKKKLSKRDGAKDLLEYRSDGYLPGAMRNFLALIGWNPGGEVELFPGTALLDAFSLEKIQRSGGAFNETKLKWMNHQYLAALPDTTENTQFKFEYVLAALPERITGAAQYSEERVRKLVPTILERVHNQTEIRAAAEAGEYDYAFMVPDYTANLLQWKNDATVRDAAPRLTHVATLLTNTDFSAPDAIKSTLWPYAEEIGRGEVLWPLRVALSGRAQSPDPFTLAYILGAEETLARITTACGKIAECQTS
jgi:glutamyl-tRNA synthetase